MDYPYIYLIVILLALTAWEAKKRDARAFYCACFVVFLFLSLRAPVVGADTWNYYRYFTGMRNYYNNDERGLEYLFILYRQIVMALSFNNGFFVMIINTFLSLVGPFLLINELSQRKTLSLLWFFLIGCYEIYFVALRQILGMSVLMIGVLYVIKSRRAKWMVFSICALIGMGIHTMTFVYAAIYFCLYFIHVKSKYVLFSIMIFCLVGGQLLNFFNLSELFNVYLSFGIEATSRIDGYLNTQSLVHHDIWQNLGSMLGLTLLASISLFYMNDKYVDHWLTKIFITGVCLFNIMYEVPMINRVVIGFSIMGVIVFTWIYNCDYLMSKSVRKTLSYVVLITVLYFTRVYIIGNSTYDFYSNGRMHPYYFFWEDYSSHPSVIIYGD